MYLGNPMNNPSQNIHTAHNAQKPAENRQAQFAIIHVRSPYTQNIPPHIIPSHTVINRTNTPLSQTTQNNIAKIMTALEPHNTQLHAPQLKTDQNTPIAENKPQNNDDNNADDKEFINNIGFAVVGGLIGAVAGTAITYRLGLGKAPIAPKPEMRDKIVSIMPELVKSVAIGTTMIATTIGLSKWLNQESPEILKVKIDALKN